MLQLFSICLLASLLLKSSECSRLYEIKTVKDYMDICLVGRHHKQSPSKEEGLVSKVCSPWAARSCCTQETALNISTDSTWLNFDWNHCGQLSPQCREYFIMDSCFYSCSPNVGPWLIEDFRKIRRERFQGVPLCETVCTRWWEACKNDLTCTDKWAENFDWSSGINKCPKGSSCKKFSEVFQNSASNFCENVFGSFKVVPENQDGSENCFHLWFDPKYPNPNEAVARRRASEILKVEYKAVEGSKLPAKKKGGHNGAARPGSGLGSVCSVFMVTGLAWLLQFAGVRSSVGLS